MSCFISLNNGQIKPGSQRTYRFQAGPQNQVELLIEKIQSGRIDITDDYENWQRIGFALADMIGESGRNYFQAVSQFHPEYNPGKTERQFTHCVRSDGKGITIASYFHLCKVHGITLKTGMVNAL